MIFNRKIIIIGLIFAMIPVFQFYLAERSGKTPENLARNILKACRTASFHPACYDEQIPKLTGNLDMKNIFRVASVVQAADASYPYCHVLGHLIGAREVSKNLENWLSILSECPTDICSNGCMHGVMQQKFKSETLTDDEISTIKPQLSYMCEHDKGAIINTLECYHSLGHLIMYVTGGDLTRAISFCRSLSNNPDYGENCNLGVFMIIFQQLEPEDRAIAQKIRPTTDELHNFCQAFAENKLSEACLEEGWPFYAADKNKTSELPQYCAKAPDSQRCYQVILYGEAQRLKGSQDDQVRFCIDLGKSGPSAFENCFKYIASGLMHSDPKAYIQSISLCNIAKKYNLGENCFKAIIELAKINLPSNSDARSELCSKIQQDIKLSCLN